MANPEFVAFLEENSYFNLRELDDGTVAGLHRLLYTTAICTGLSWHSWAYRYCFEDPKQAADELGKLSAMDDVPDGFVARRQPSRR